MRTALILAAVGIVLLANSWLLVSVARNRGEAPGGTVELTERELRLRPVGGESTALFLELDWDTLATQPGRRGAARWLDAAKLATLGFDCRLPATDPDAKTHYQSSLARLLFVVLEYEGDAWRQAEADRRRATRLFAVDAGGDPQRLREQYDDPTRYLIAKGLVKLRWEQLDRASSPRLQGWIQALVPSQVFVPRPHNRVFRGLEPRDGSSDSAEPRFVATLSWGRNHEPWLTAARRIGRPTSHGPTAP